MVLDVRSRVLYSGDSVQDGNIFLFGPARDIDVFPSSLRRLDAYRDRYDVIFPSHGTIPVSPDLTEDIIRGAADVAAGRISGHEAEVFGHKIMVYDIGGAKILGDARIF